MDWDFDGDLDLLSGCYWTQGKDGGHIQILKGLGKGDDSDWPDFEKATSLLSGAEKPLENVSLAKDPNPNGMDDNQTKNICTEQHAVDYDGDGDLDLVVGCFANNFFLYENEGSEKENKLVEKPVELELTMPDYHAAPHLADFDGDGDLDFLTGSGGGGVYIAINEGTREEPKYGEFKTLVDKPANPYESQRPEEVSMSGGTRIWATDFNRDGLMDLLVGDSVTMSQPADGVSDEEYVKLKAEHKKKMARMMARMTELEESGREMTEKFQRKFFDKFGKFMQSSSKFENEEQTGHVWILLQKPKTEKDVTRK